MIVRELVTQLGFTMSKGQLANAEKGVEKLKGTADSAANAIRNIAGAFLGFASIQAIVRIGDEMQSVRARIALLPQTIGDVSESFDVVAERAIASRSSINAYADLYTRVGHAAKKYITTQDDLLTVTDAVSQGLVVGGATVQETESVMTQLSQAIGSGVLAGQEFNSMAEGAPQLLEKLAVAMGHPREKLKDLASQGKITSKDLVMALLKVAPDVRREFMSIPLTVGQAITKVGGRFSMMVEEMNRKTLFITKIADSIVSGFDKIESGVNSVVESFGGWENALRLIGVAVSVAFGAKALSILAAFKVAGFATMLPFVKMIAIITAVTLVIEDLYVWINGGDSLIGRMVGEWKEYEKTVTLVIGLVKVLSIMISGLVAGFLLIKVALIAIASIQRVITIATAIWAGMVAIVTSPFLLLLVVLAAVLGSFYLLVTHGEVIKKWFGGFFSWMGDKFGDIARWIGDLLGKAAPLFGLGGGDGKPGANGKPGASSNNPSAFTPIGSAIGPASLAPAAMGAGRPNVQSNTNVTVTVPQGTSAEQAKFLQGAAQQSFSKAGNDKLARDVAVYAG